MKALGGRQKNRESDPQDARIRAWIALAIIGVGLGIFIATLALVADDKDSVKMVLGSAQGLILLVLGYYFGRQR